MRVVVLALLAGPLGLAAVLAGAHLVRIDPIPPAALVFVVATVASLVRFRDRIAAVLGRLSPSRALAVATAVGLVARLAWVLAARTEPVSDYAVYHELGLRLAETGAFATPDGVPTNWRPVGIPALVAAFATVGLDPVRGLGLVNAVALTSVIPAVFLFTRRWASDGAAVAAAGLVALCPSALFIASLVATEPLAIAATAWALVGLAHIERRTASFAHAAALGALLGVAALVRPNLFLVPFGYGAFALALGPHRRARTLRFGVVALVMVLLLLPWGFRNQAVTGRFALLPASGGWAAWMANNPDATGTTLTGRRWSVPLRGLDEEARGKKGWALALAWARRHPDRVLGLVPRKWGHLLSSQQSSASQPIVHSPWKALLLRPAHAWTQLNYVLLLALGFLGTVLGAHALEAAGTRTLAVQLILLLGQHAWFHGEPRYNAVLIPTLCACAGAFFLGGQSPSASVDDAASPGGRPAGSGARGPDGSARARPS